jgi:hypothetical protein
MRVIICSLLLCCAYAAAAPVYVSGRAGGSFGSPVSGSFDFVEGHQFTAAGESVTISATGIVYGLGLSNPSGPDGWTVWRPIVAGYTPLEEFLVDTGTPVGSLPTYIPNVAALIGAFVPEATASNPLFVARDEDFATVGIPSSALFLIGAGPFVYTAPGAGRLYLGINEPYMSNNNGGLDVTIAAGPPVPEPSAVLLLGLAAACGCLARVRRR